MTCCGRRRATSKCWAPQAWATYWEVRLLCPLHCLLRLANCGHAGFLRAPHRGDWRRHEHWAVCLAEEPRKGLGCVGLCQRASNGTDSLGCRCLLLSGVPIPSAARFIGLSSMK
jgi:hypothetical protein